MTLYADNLNQFVNGQRTFYTVPSGNYKRGDVVTLHDNYNQYAFKIYTVVNWGEHTILGLGGVRDDQATSEGQ